MCQSSARRQPCRSWSARLKRKASDQLRWRARTCTGSRLMNCWKNATSTWNRSISSHRITCRGARQPCRTASCCSYCSAAGCCWAHSGRPSRSCGCTPRRGGSRTRSRSARVSSLDAAHAGRDERAGAPGGQRPARQDRDGDHAGRPGGKGDPERLAALRGGHCQQTPEQFAEYLTRKWREEHLCNLV